MTPKELIKEADDQSQVLIKHSMDKVSVCHSANEWSIISIYIKTLEEALEFYNETSGRWSYDGRGNHFWDSRTRDGKPWDRAKQALASKEK
jgi:hypothetical protein